VYVTSTNNCEFYITKRLAIMTDVMCDCICNVQFSFMIISSMQVLFPFLIVLVNHLRFSSADLVCTINVYVIIIISENTFMV